MWSVAITSYTAAASPTGLILASVYSSSATITWDNIVATKYTIERAPDNAGSPGAYTIIKNWADNIIGTTYTDATLSGETTYWYRIKSYNGDGVLNNTPSLQIGVLTLSGPPSVFMGVAISSCQIMWSWLDASNSEAGFKIYTATGGLITTLSANTTFWTEGGLQVNTAYSRYAVSYNSSGESPASNNYSKYTLAMPPVLAVTSVGNNSVNLLWSTYGATKFKLDRSADNGVLWTTTTDYYVLPTFTDEHLVQNTSYWYRIWGVIC